MINNPWKVEYLDYTFFGSRVDPMSHIVNHYYWDYQYSSGLMVKGIISLCSDMTLSIKIQVDDTHRMCRLIFWEFQNKISATGPLKDKPTHLFLPSHLHTSKSKALFIVMEQSTLHFFYLLLLLLRVSRFRVF